MRSKQITYPFNTAAPMFDEIKRAVIDFRSKGKQDVLPPSVHPDTGQPYQWKGDFTKLPMIPDALLALWGSLVDLSTQLISKPAQGLSVDDVYSKLARLDPDMAMYEWVQVGMGLQHELGQDGFYLWNDWSKRGSKYAGKRDLQTRWRGFKSDGGVTIAVLDRLLAPQPTPDDYDVIPDDDSDNAEVIEEPKGSAKFPSYSFKEVCERPTPEWIVEDLIPERGLGLLYGEPGSGKSFLAVELSHCMALGRPWRGLYVEQCGVMYLAAEGQGGVPGRFRALHKHTGQDPTDHLWLMDGGPSLLNMDWREIVKEIKYRGNVRVVIVDTLAQTIAGGDENSSETMGIVIKHCKQIAAATGVVVILVHHSGKDASKGARGHSSLHGAADFEIETTRSGDTRMMRVAKQKDGADGAVWGFKLMNVDTGRFNKRGKAENSCVVVPADVVVQSVDGATELEKILIQSAQSLADAAGKDRVPKVDVIREAAKRKSNGAPDPKGNAFRVMKMALNRSVTKGFITVEGEMVVCEMGDNA